MYNINKEAIREIFPRWPLLFFLCMVTILRA